MGLHGQRRSVVHHILIAVALLTPACCAPRRPPSADMFSLLASAQGRDPNAAERLLAQVREKYGACRSYRDRGTTTAIVWMDGRRSIDITRFDTVFVRGVGLRFQSFDEAGRRRVAIWQDGEIVSTWLLGAVRNTSLDEALSASAGVTNLASSVVPALLLGRSLPPFARPSGTFGVAGIAPIGCGKCTVLTTPPDPHTRALSITVDEGASAVRRFSYVTKIPAAEDDPTPFVAEHIVAYEAQFDLADESEVVQELQRAPW